MTELEERVREEAEKVVDPETGLTFGQMKMITDVKEEESGVVEIDFVPSSPFCPIAFKLTMDIKKAAESVEGIKRVLVYCRGHTMEEAINKMVNKPQMEIYLPILIIGKVVLSAKMETKPIPWIEDLAGVDAMPTSGSPAKKNHKTCT